MYVLEEENEKFLLSGEGGKLGIGHISLKAVPPNTNKLS